MKQSRAVGWLLVLGTVTLTIQALLTNYATVDVPDFFNDKWRVWLTLGNVVQLGLIIALISQRGATKLSTSVEAKESFEYPRSSIDRCFGRELELSHISKMLRSPNGTFVVIAGPGGIGKTTLAANISQLAADRGFRYFWVRGGDDREIASQFVRIALQLGMRNQRNVSEVEYGSPDFVWSFLTTRRRWIIVVDDLSPKWPTVSTIPVSEYRGWIRPYGGGLLVVTSRDRSPETWGRSAKIVELGELGKEAGANLLADLAPAAGSRESAMQLSSRLGGIPLALYAAGTTISRPLAKISTFQDYHAAVDHSIEILAEQTSDDAPRYRANLVNATCELSLDQLSSEGFPFARPLLRSLSLLAAAPIPVALLRADLVPLSERPYRDVSPSEIDRTLNGMHRYGLLDSADSGGEQCATVHPLIRELNSFKLEKAGPTRKWKTATSVATLRTAAEFTRQGKGAWPAIAALSVHFLHGMTKLELLNSRFTSQTGNLVCEISRGLRAYGKIDTEIQMLRQLLNCEEDGTLAYGQRVNSIGVAQTLFGNHLESKASHCRALSVYERVPCLDSVDALTSIVDLGIAHSRCGEYEQALDLLLRAKTATRAKNELRNLHLRAQSEIGFCFNRTNKTQEAEEILRATLEFQVDYLGESHPDALRTLNNLAVTLSITNRPEEARRIHDDVLSMRTDVLGELHPETLTSQNNLAVVLHQLGEFDRSTYYHRRNLDLLTLCCFHSNNNLATCARNLERSLSAQGLVAEAYAVRERMGMAAKRAESYHRR
jgi:tetratricopeptide (TPR) repeat protein